MAKRKFKHVDVVDIDPKEDEAYAFYVYEKSKKTLSCKYCGEKAVHWDITKKGWGLFNNFNNGIHKCPALSGEYLKDLMKTIPSFILNNQKITKEQCGV